MLFRSVRNPAFIVVQYSDERGMPTSYNLVALGQSIEDVIRNEQLRRDDVLDSIISVGPSFESSNYGTLQFNEDGSFIWNGYQRLSSSIIPSNSGNTGFVTFKHFLDPSLSFTYDGAITFTFDRNNRSVTFLYELTEGGIRLEDATGATFRDALITSRSGSPLVMFFSKVASSTPTPTNDSVEISME